MEKDVVQALYDRALALAKAAVRARLRGQNYHSVAPFVLVDFGVAVNAEVLGPHLILRVRTHRADVLPALRDAFFDAPCVVVPDPVPASSPPEYLAYRKLRPAEVEGLTLEVIREAQLHGERELQQDDDGGRGVARTGRERV